MKKAAILIFLFTLLFNTQLHAQEKKEVKSATIVYGSEDCHYCIATQKYLKDHAIAFVFYDIDRNPEALQEMLSKLKAKGISTSNLGIPVIDQQGVIFTNTGVFEEFLQKLK